MAVRARLGDLLCGVLVALACAPSAVAQSVNPAYESLPALGEAPYASQVDQSLPTAGGMTAMAPPSAQVVAPNTAPPPRAIGRALEVGTPVAGPPGLAQAPMSSVIAPTPQVGVPQQSVVPAGRVLPVSYVDCGDGCIIPRVDPGYSYWFGGVELTLLAPHYENPLFQLRENGTAVGPRLFVGWESARGLGFRGRFWGLQQGADATFEIEPPDDDSTVLFTAGRFDFDVYRRFSWDGSSITVGGSVTAAELDYKFRFDQLFEPLHIEDSGGGAGFFVEGRHLFLKTPVAAWSVLMRGRWAALVGEWRLRGDDGPEEGDSTMEIFEANLGYEYRRDFSSCSFVFQHTLEAQAWDAEFVGDVNFLGQTLSLGLNW